MPDFTISQAAVIGMTHRAENHIPQNGDMDCFDPLVKNAAAQQFQIAAAAMFMGREILLGNTRVAANENEFKTHEALMRKLQRRSVLDTGDFAVEAAEQRAQDHHDQDCFIDSDEFKELAVKLYLFTALALYTVFGLMAGFGLARIMDWIPATSR